MVRENEWRKNVGGQVGHNSACGEGYKLSGRQDSVGLRDERSACVLIGCDNYRISTTTRSILQHYCTYKHPAWPHIQHKTLNSANSGE